MNTQCLALMSVFNTAAPGKVDPTECLGIGAELSGRLTHTQPDPGIPTQFSLYRARLDMGVDIDGVGARIRTTAVRSATEGSYIGVDGESVLMRISVAEARWTEADWGLTLSAGMVQDAWVTTSNTLWGLRALEATLSQRIGVMDASDIGSTVVWTSPKRRVTLVGQMTSGEGFKYRERNDGINTSGLLTVRPIATNDADLELSGFVRDGSKGNLLARNHRYGARVAGRWGFVKGGMSYLKALGNAGRILAEPSVTSTWFTANIPMGILAAARADFANWRPDNAQSQNYLVAVGPTLPLNREGKAPGALLLGVKQTRNTEAGGGVAGAATYQNTQLYFLQLQFRGKHVAGIAQ